MGWTAVFLIALFYSENDSDKIADQLMQKLKEYEQEHRDLDQILIQLQYKHTVDFLQIQRLKKRKLVLKDKIIYLKNKLEPDIIA